MAGRGRTTFKKRQKEQLRLERRQQKAAKMLERKTLKENPPAESDLELGHEPELDAGLEPENEAGLEPEQVTFGTE